jgi:hypothetical protein
MSTDRSSSGIFEVAAFPRDVVELAALGDSAAREHVSRSVDRRHVPGPARRFDRQQPCRTEIGDVNCGQRQASARPGGPASSWDELPPLVAVDRETVFSQTQHFREA